ncbi:hypothetical protein [Spirosoma endbachense]|uniref:Immunogenic protein (Bcsp31-1) n=1 Tax=Spirosoma endbachense TaxID=2666025 RepID=A0A6P1W641_9BACT|nr:hypothetical protein [Spirosoma endbachense]QHW00486.1 hypothetical protein GJR95_38105 [Spirosoma endbachense]
MRTNLKNLLVLFALATTFTLASCQSESVEPQAAPVKKTTQAHPALADDEADQPPKDGNGGGN